MVEIEDMIISSIIAVKAWYSVRPGEIQNSREAAADRPTVRGSQPPKSTGVVVA